jgi:hypothetical protein
MQYTKDLNRATKIEYGKCRMYGDPDIFNHCDMIMKYIAPRENALMKEINDAMGDRWPISISVSFSHEYIRKEGNLPMGLSFADWQGRHLQGNHIDYAACRIHLCVRDNHHQAHTFLLFQAKGVQGNTSVPTHTHLRYVDYSDIQLHSEPLKFSFNADLHPLCDSDIISGGKQSQLIYDMDNAIKSLENNNKTLAAENKELKDALAKLEKKMETLMEFISMKL